MDEIVKFGILGGMGPLASAASLTTFYNEFSKEIKREQDLPNVILSSKCDYQDRTEVLRKDDMRSFKKKILEEYTSLIQLGCTDVVINCITAHFILGEKIKNLDKCHSLLDLIKERICQEKEKTLILCTSGSANYFEKFLATENATIPNKDDQRRVHNLIYKLKIGTAKEEDVKILFNLSLNYNTSKIIYGCTELQLVNRFLVPEIETFEIIDPFKLLIEKLKANYFNSETFKAV